MSSDTKRCCGWRRIPAHDAPITEFYKNQTAKDRLQSLCKKCTKEHHKESNPKSKAKQAEQGNRGGIAKWRFQEILDQLQWNKENIHLETTA